MLGALGNVLGSFWWVLRPKAVLYGLMTYLRFYVQALTVEAIGESPAKRYSLSIQG